MDLTLPLDHAAIERILPHRYPFLLVDRVLECHPGHSIRALKNVTYNEPYFPGHFPGRPVMPGVIIIEAMAQTAGILCFVTANVIPDAKTRSSTTRRNNTWPNGLACWTIAWPRPGASMAPRNLPAQ